jgi:hypothetical protein
MDGAGETDVETASEKHATANRKEEFVSADVDVKLYQGREGGNKVVH